MYRIALAMYHVALAMYRITLAMYWLALALHRIALAMRRDTLALSCDTLALSCDTLAMYRLTTLLHCEISRLYRLFLGRTEAVWRLDRAEMAGNCGFAACVAPPACRTCLACTLPHPNGGVTDRLGGRWAAAPYANAAEFALRLDREFDKWARVL
jgi:hypothetical protein